jgi:hypothetical protein
MPKIDETIDTMARPSVGIAMLVAGGGYGGGGW